MKGLINLITTKLSALVKAHTDKVLHLTVSFFLMIVLAFFGVPLIVATVITLLLGTLKEVYDLKVQKTYFSKADLVFDFLGVILALGIMT